MSQHARPSQPQKMPSKFYSDPLYQNKKTPPHRDTGCVRCNEGYLTCIPPTRGAPHLLRQEFRRHPLNAPKLAPLCIPGSLNHADIASLRPQVQPGQEPYPFLTDRKPENLAKARGKQSGSFLPKYSWRGLIAFAVIYYCLV